MSLALNKSDTDLNVATTPINPPDLVEPDHQDSKPQNQQQNQQQPNLEPDVSPADTAGIFSQIVFSWLSPLLKLGSTRRLEERDMLPLPKSVETKRLYQQYCQVEQDLFEQFQVKPTTFQILKGVVGKEFLFAGLFKLIHDLALLIGPILVQMIIQILEDPTIPSEQGYYLAGGLVLNYIIMLINIHQYFYRVMTVGLKVSSMLTAVVYEKALKLNTSLSTQPTGTIVNLMSTDIGRISILINSLHLLWSSPFQIFAILFLLYTRVVGPACFAGVGLMILAIPINTYLSKRLTLIRRSMYQFADSRLKTLNEILQGIRVIKFFALEDHFLKKIFSIRQGEIEKLVQFVIWQARTSFVFLVIPSWIGVAVFVVYTLLGNTLTPDVAFTALIYFRLLIFPVAVLPGVLIQFIDVRISFGRLKTFFDQAETHQVEIQQHKTLALMIEDGSFSWGRPLSEETINPDTGDESTLVDVELKNLSMDSEGNDGESPTGNSGSLSDQQDTNQPTNNNDLTPKDTNQTSNNTETPGDTTSSKSQNQPPSKQDAELKIEKFTVLHDINVKIKKGSLVAIVGTVGSGKSSLLSSFLGESSIESGKISVFGSLAYSSQSSWIINATIKENILFFKPFSEKKYKTICRICCLEPDFQLFPAGDATEIGENGINLSGGQKARVSLARALYSDADIYLFDDPLSAVDVHVGNDLFQNVFASQSYLASKTRIIVTHKVEILPEFDQIIVMDKGKIVENDSPQILSADPNSQYTKIIQHLISTETHDDQVDQEDELNSPRPEDLYSSASTSTVSKSSTRKKSLVDGRLVEEEERSTGAVEWWIWKKYFEYCGGYFKVLFLIILIQSANHLFITGQDIWLSIWADSSSKEKSSYAPDISISTWVYLLVYFAISMISSVLTYKRSIFIGKFSLKASKTLFDNFISCVIHTQTSWLDVTPIGRIMNRGAKDTDGIDQVLPHALSMLLHAIYSILAMILVVSFVSPWAIILFVILGYFYNKIQKYFRRSSIEFRRIASVTKSPIFAQFSETLTGLGIIRSFHKSQVFSTANMERIDLNARPSFLNFVSYRWLGTRLEFIGICTTGFVAFFAIFLRGEISAGAAGLALSYAITTTGWINWVIRVLIELENEFNGVERILEYSDAPIEAPSRIEETEPPESWPSKGEIKFVDLNIRYRPDLPLALSHFSTTIKAGSRVGIVGRTGSGKSTLLKALFRFIEPSQGYIDIDGVDVTKIGLKNLRDAISIVPQEPILFQGSIRSNLSIGEEFSDDQLWDALSQVSMKQKIHEAGGLDSPVSLGGTNFSVGERQLICFARTLLRNAKIVTLDEATASVDSVSDQVIQKTIRTLLHDRTLLIIAHRLETIMDLDYVMVLDSGKLAEFDHPWILLENSNSIFTSMVQETGNQASHLIQLANSARDAYQ